MKLKFLFVLFMFILIGIVFVQVKLEDVIKFCQFGYIFMVWNMGCIKMNVEGMYNKDEVIKLVNVIQVIVVFGMGMFYLLGIDKGKGWEDICVKLELFINKEGVGKVVGVFVKEVNEMVKVVVIGDVVVVKE